ncbi:hypothetical protein P280DRAFT_183408 [Massarina eburnea CBS 473.64]|uniref:Uncharacterized protein n=1 Tax=Massarina eburnea CBS 473.64 TaxID=1395130 RepID=A0A6A6SCB2_9PLEO|nr:hypothetical protein P280DRAFT_183408 [Massarina eburnea CBS 473.64]
MFTFAPPLHLFFSSLLVSIYLSIYSYLRRMDCEETFCFPFSSLFGMGGFFFSSFQDSGYQMFSLHLCSATATATIY